MGDLLSGIADFAFPDRWRLFADCCVDKLPTGHDTRDDRFIAYRQWFVERKNREFHTWPEILVVLSGEALFGWMDSVRLLTAGSIVLIGAGEIHAYLYPEGHTPTGHLWIAARDGVWSATLYGRDRIVTGRFSDAEGVFPPFLASWHGATGTDLGSRPSSHEDTRSGSQMLHGLILKHLAISAVLQTSEGLLHRTETKSKTDSVVEWAVEFIDSHPHQRLFLDDLAERVGYSKYHFLRLFRSRTGKTPGEYLTVRRIAFAGELLRAGYSCKATAYELGFSEPSAFSRWYKRCTGIAPGQVGMISR